MRVTNVLHGPFITRFNVNSSNLNWAEPTRSVLHWCASRYKATIQGFHANNQLVGCFCCCCYCNIVFLCAGRRLHCVITYEFCVTTSFNIHRASLLRVLVKYCKLMRLFAERCSCGGGSILLLWYAPRRIFIDVGGHCRESRWRKKKSILNVYRAQW